MTSHSSFLRSWRKDAAETFLEKLPGIGPKSARCVLAYALGEQSLRGGTRIRVASLGGLASSKTKPGKPNHEAFEAAIPKAARIRLHVNLVHHGRAVCRESAPRCGSCSLISFCETGRSKVAPTAGHAAVVDLFGGAGAMGLGFRAGWLFALQPRLRSSGTLRSLTV